MPSAETTTFAVSPGTLAPSEAPAPLADQTILATPEPPVSSMACSVTVVSLVVQPAALAAGEPDAVVTGGVASAHASTR